MAIDNYKVTTSEVNGKNVKSAPDVLTSDAQTNKNWFDRLVEYFISKYNGLIDYLQSNLVGRDAAGRGLTYKNDKLNWRYAVDKGSSFGINFSGNIQQTIAGTYETVISDNIPLTQTDLMDCFMYINDVEYECGDSWADGVLFYTKTKINATEIRLTYNSLTKELVMSSSSNPLDTTYWNVELYRGEAEKVKRKSLPGDLTNDAYTELKDRIDALTGTIGKTIAGTVIEYGVSADEATPPAAWQSTVPVTTAGQWLWVRTTIIYNDLSEDTSYTKTYIGTDGEDGISVTVQSVHKEGNYTIVTLIDSDGNITTLQIADGNDGDDGVDGESGYIHFAWANSADGSVDFSTHESFGKQYLGVCYDFNVEDPQTYTSYSWTLIKGADGQDGTDGRDGADGKTVKSIVHQYYISTSSSTKSGGSWSDTLNYVSGRYVWTRDVITYNDDTVAYSPSEAGKYNADITNKSQKTYDTEQHFWVKSTGGTTQVPTGAYITRVAREDFDNESPYSGSYAGPNLHLTSDDVNIRSGAKVYATYNGSGVHLYDGNGVAAGNLVGEFAASRAQIGRNASGESRAEITGDGLSLIRNVSGTGTEIAHLGYGSGKNQNKTNSNAPYYTLGVRSGTIGNYSVVEGQSTASAWNSHAEGASTASDNFAHAEGTSTASGNTSHAEGIACEAAGTASHAEGWGSKVLSTCSSAHASGYYTIAASNDQTVIGKYNKEDSYSAYSFIIGNGSGTSASSRSNALAVDWYGGIYVNGHSNPIGTYYHYNGTASPGSSWNAVTTTNLTRISLTAGKWIINGSAKYEANGTGYRGLAIYNTTTSGVVTRSYVTANAVAGGYETCLRTTAFLDLAGSNTYTLYCRQTSGGTLSADVDIEAIRIV